MKCEDCNTTLRYGICTNCYEELYINDYQMPEDPPIVSKKWMETVDRQRKENATHNND